MESSTAMSAKALPVADTQARRDAATQLMVRAEARRIAALGALPKETQAELGQFFTPNRAAQFLAGLPNLGVATSFRVLDPGAGSGVLTAAMAARALVELEATELLFVAVEVDLAVVPYLCETLADVEATLSEFGFAVRTELVSGSYIDLAIGMLGAIDFAERKFDLVIMNPPYKKLASSSVERKNLSRFGAECSNLYAAFLALGAESLESGGQLVAITPRSFANGPYFSQFRGYFLDRISLDRLHVFESRSTVFSDTGVLQENIVFSGTKDGTEEKVTISVSRGHEDESAERIVPYSDVVRPGDKGRFIRILAADSDTKIAETMIGMPASLEELDLTASTGRVVDFRSRECLVEANTPNAYPLVYPGNFANGVIIWPRAIKKPQGFGVVTDKDSKLLLPEGFYVLVKRFSAKEERRRLVAAVWDPSRNPGPVAVENHVNVFHHNGGGIDRDLAVGLSNWLNSSLVDNYFRTFSGHTQVNATDLRSLRFPTRETLAALGSSRDAELPGQGEVDTLIETLVTVGGSKV